MQRKRLDQALADRGLANSRSQAESLIKLGYARVDGVIVKKPGKFVSEKNAVMLTSGEKYVSRGALKLGSVAEALSIDFRGKSVLDVGSSTGGFTDYALKHGAAKIVAVDTGTNQLHPRLQGHSQIELHEQTDIRDLKSLSTKIDVVLIDVSFISAQEILPFVSKLVPKNAQIIVMVKPQFEDRLKAHKNRGVIKNKTIRRDILKNFEQWASTKYKILSKADSLVAGEKGNVERFYSLKLLG